MHGLTEEQKRRMEESRKAALERRAAKLKEQPQPPSLPTQPKEQSKPLTFATKLKDQTQPPALASPPKMPRLAAPAKNEEVRPVKGVCRLVSRDRFVVDVPYHEQLIHIFKTMPSRMYDQKDRKWGFSLKDHDDLKKAVAALGPKVSFAPLPPSVLQVFLKAPSKEAIPDYDLSSIDEKLSQALLPFQREGVWQHKVTVGGQVPGMASGFGIWKEGRLLIGDDMGLGKTLQALGIAAYYCKEWPLLIVAPSSVRYAWLQSIQQWLPSVPSDKIQVIHTGKEPLSTSLLVLITSYDLMSRRKDELRSRRFQVVVMDESHLLKSIKSGRTKVAMPILRAAKRAILLSGTPALSRPVELFNQLNAVDPRLFPSYQDFGVRYCDGKEGPFGWDFSGSSHMSELQLLMEERIMIRRLKSEVISQLPAKRRQMVMLDPSEVKNNSREMKHFSKMLKSATLKTTEKRSQLLQYFRETAQAKLKAVCDYILDLVASDRKFLCFAHHHSMMDGLCEALDKKEVKYIRIDGSTNPETRQFLCDKFQYNDAHRAAILSITAASQGLTLTAAQLVVFAELFWNPGLLTQAEDRAHRIGQEDCVIVQYLLAEGTADDHLWPMIQRKLDVLHLAGLSNDDFRDADTTRVGVSRCFFRRFCA
ncbi:unnamed protein product [Darwinula stevensoni]|uniref:SWI/SNF-related matrix-associated actin-dependent regulator of chromatin subfamily A-like protein 1 n=1 Tax=Darwinula stevensoni TaxID=69355 RepID=A0A7R8XHD2_9CRUS|nr:unnamed protein product [Darwinula stevensoni]CAG0890319.1 unnamed protein product [Darwinula stevensoni]